MKAQVHIQGAVRAGMSYSGRARRKVATLIAALFLVSGAMQAQTGPVISSLLVNGVASTTGPVGATLTIQGSGFGSTPGFSTVTLNGIALAGNGVKPTSWSPTSIVVVIPRTATSGPLIVKVLGKASNSISFAIGALVTSVSPATALVGASVTISGSGFGTAGGTVTFNGTPATTSGWTDASIVAQVPNGATAGPIVVTVNSQVSNGIAFTPTPSISSLSPNFGLTGAPITISGNSFGTQSNAGTVTFNGVTAAVTTWSNTSIAVTAPSGALTGNVIVTVNGVASSGRTFTYTPQITQVSPSPALADTPVTIQGNNFGAQQGTAGTLTFNGVTAGVTSWSNTSISATVPGNATAGPVVVTVNGVASNGIAFSLPALYSFRLSYAPDGDVLAATDSVNGNWTYTYDDFNRLSTANNSSPVQGFSYSYDQYGNRWQQDLTAGSGGREILTFSGSANASTNGNCYHAAGQTNQPDGSCFDAAGNLLNDGQHSYIYDAENRIIAVDGGQTETYDYDAAGNRIRKVNAGGTSASYLYDLEGHVVTELNSTGAWTRGEVYAGGRHLGTYADGVAGTTYLAQADWLGNERTKVLLSGDLFETCANLPFGDGLNCSGSADPSPDHFTGKQRDSETSLDYFGARYYSSAMGRFITPDWEAKAAAVPYAEFSDPQSLNLYAYVRGIATSDVDVDGHSDAWLMKKRAEERWAKMTPEERRRDHLKNIAIATAPASLGVSLEMAVGSVLLRNLFGLGLYAASTPTGQAVLNGIPDAIAPPGTPSFNLTGTAASVEDKLSRYLLNAEHAEGGSKAAWFQQALGFNKDNLKDLASQIKFDSKTAVETGKNDYGVLYNQVINITGANGKIIPVTFAWIRKYKDNAVALVTAIPTSR